MSNAGRNYAIDDLASLLGITHGTGFHIEMFGRVSAFWDDPVRGDGTRFPCIDDNNKYTGCLGAACQAKTCWAGRLVPSAVHSQDGPPSPSLQRRGAQCHACALATDTAEGTVTCAAGHFDRPISLSGLIRKRIPECVPLPCSDFEAAETVRPEVLRYRQLKSERAAERRAAKLHEADPTSNI